MNDERYPKQALQDALDIYLSGRAGIRFQELASFAGPLFDLYDVDWRRTKPSSTTARDHDELSTMLAVLDAARLLWAFFSLDEDRSVVLLPELEDAMLGPNAGDEERSNLLILLSLLEEHWRKFSPEDRQRAESIPGYALPEFETLLREFGDAEQKLRGTGSNQYGPEHLELPEALALFAEPLLPDAPAKQDPDHLEERIARAQAYWDLAQTPKEFFEQQLKKIQKEFATTEQNADSIRREAERMVRRYHDLFSGRKGSSTRER